MILNKQKSNDKVDEQHHIRSLSLCKWFCEDLRSPFHASCFPKLVSIIFSSEWMHYRLYTILLGPGIFGCGFLLGLQDGQWKPLVVLGGFATVDSNQLSASWQETCPRGKLWRATPRNRVASSDQTSKTGGCKVVCIYIYLSIHHIYIYTISMFFYWRRFNICRFLGANMLLQPLGCLLGKFHSKSSEKLPGPKKVKDLLPVPIF